MGNHTRLKRQRASAIILALLGLLGTIADIAKGFSASSDSGIYGPPYAEILKKIESWPKQYPDISEAIDYGKTAQGRTLRLLIVRRQVGIVPERPTLVLSGSTHGSEYLNLEDRLPELILGASSNGPVKRFLDNGGVFIFIPILNPDGYETRRRGNSHGVDLNRDWDLARARFKGFTEVESQRLSEAIEQLRKKYHLTFKITVDYHCCGASLLHPWAYQKSALPSSDLVRHQTIGELARKHLKVAVGSTKEVLGEGYDALGTSKDYYYDRYGALAFTYEGRFGVENQYLGKHLSWWKAMVDSLLLESSSPLFTTALSKVRTYFQIAE